MLSAAAAAGLLARATNVGRVTAIATELRFDSRAERLTAALREKLSLPSEITHASLMRGPGALRALLIELPETASPRDTVAKVASALWSSAPHCLWLLLGCVPQGATVFISAWSIQDGRAHVRALIVDRHHVYASEAETLCALTSACDGLDLVVHTRWLEILGRDVLTRRFYVLLREVVQELGESLPHSVGRHQRAELALLNVSRLLLLSFLQARGWLNNDHGFLQNAYDTGIATGGRVHARVLQPLFFGTLNTRPPARQPRAQAFGRIPYLNGGLFARAAVERAHRSACFPDAPLGRAFGDLLSRYRFTPEEELAEWSDVAIDPVILGRAFESLMDEGARKRTGTYYTPAAVVERATRVGLEHALAGDGISPDVVVLALDGQQIDPEVGAALLKRVRTIRVLDPACGSGAFLVYALKVLADLRVHLGQESLTDARRAVLANSIFGVDLSPTAVWLCELRLWLSLTVDGRATDPLAVPPLPNLDRNIRVGDSLSGETFTTGGRSPREATQVATLRRRYVGAQGQRKRTLARALDAAERSAALAVVDSRLALLKQRRHELLSAVRSHDLFGARRAPARNAAELRRLRAEVRSIRADRDRIRDGAALAFSFHVQFAEVARAGGFDAIIGNPPWVRPHKLSSASRAQLRERFTVCRARPAAASEAGVSLNRSFGAQVDLAAPFVERSLELLRPGGTLALLVPAKLWSSLAGAGLRQFALLAGELLVLEDFSAGQQIFAAATYPSLIALARPVRIGTGSQNSVGTGPQNSVRIAIHRRNTSVEWTARSAEIRLAPNPLAPWLLVPPQVRRAFDRLSRAGRPLGQTAIGAPRLGVKTGCNDAFVVRVAAHCDSLAEIHSGERHGWVERALLRPALRGEFVRAWRTETHPAEFLIWTHDEADRPLARLPQHAGTWLRRWRQELTTRADFRQGDPWWRLFRTPAARCHRHRVVWCDIGRSPRALVLGPGDHSVPINTCYVAFANEEDAWALAALLNGPLATAWLNVLAEPARGGYRRFLGWTMAALPVPANEGAFRDTLCPLGRAAADGHEISAAELLDAALAAYGIRDSDVQPLLEWRDVQ